MIVKVKKGYKIKYHTTGKLGNKIYKTREQAERVIKLMKSYKNMKDDMKNDQISKTHKS